MKNAFPWVFSYLSEKSENTMVDVTVAHKGLGLKAH